MFQHDKIKNSLFIAITALATFLSLYAFRAADDNNTSSWQWMLDGRNVAGIYGLLLAGVAVAYLVSRIDWKERSTLTALFFLSFGIAVLFWNIPNFILDSSRYFTQAKYLELYGLNYFLQEWGGKISPWTDLPAIPCIFGLIFKLFGESRTVIQAFTTILFSLTILITAKIGKTLWNDETGIQAGALLLGIPYIFIQVPLMLVDIPTMFFLTLSTFSVVLAIKKGGFWRIAFAAIAVFLAFFSKYSSWPMLSVLFIVIAVYYYSSTQSRSQILSRSASMMLLSVLLIGSVIILKFDVISEQVQLLRSFQAPGLRRWGESLFSTFFFQVHPFITLSALFSMYAAVRMKDVRYLIILWLPLLVAAFNIPRTRYILPTFPMLALMAAHGLQRIKDPDARKFIVSCAVLSSLVVAIAAYRPFTLGKPPANIQEAGSFLDRLNVEAVRVFTLVQQEEVANPAILVPLLDLHTRKRLIFDYEPGSFPPAQEIELSNLRFTWEYRNPSYYSSGPDIAGDANYPMVVISRDAERPLPASLARRAKFYDNSRKFNAYDDRFHYKITVQVFW